MPDHKKSCAACCGIYNTSEGRRETIASNLERRTALFTKINREIEALLGFQAHIKRLEDPKPYEPIIHVCEFAGYLDADHRIVGCMLHPKAPGNRGIDLRGLCHYGAMACKAFYCPAWRQSPHRFNSILVDIIDDWYLYGLIVTDVDLVNSLFYLIEKHCGTTDLDALKVNSSARGRIFELFELKSTECLSNSELRLSRYYFHGSGLDGKSISHARAMEANGAASGSYATLTDGNGRSSVCASEDDYLHLDRICRSIAFTYSLSEHPIIRDQVEQAIERILKAIH